MIKTENFKTWLQQNEKLASSSIEEHIRNINYFTAWATANSFSPTGGDAEGRGGNIDHITYTELLSYVQYEKEKGIKVQTVKLRLNTLKKYYEYLKHIGIIEKNPTKKINLKGEQKTITQNVFSYSELEQLYNDFLNMKYEAYNKPLLQYTKQRNNIVLGLMIFQGAVSGEIEKIIVEHVNLEQGTIYIPKCRRGAARELKLFPKQILQLYGYINEARSKLNPKENELIPGIANNHTHVILQQLKGINQKVNNASQLRTSIIIHWLKVYGKRQAQYMAGHKYISSTEKFELQEIDSLTDTLLKHHPFS